jgi:hypothetical protein
MTAVSPFLSFPSISWWMQVACTDTVIFDVHEHFEKMTGRNRYRVSGANNPVMLSIPLVNGRNQHVPMKDIAIFSGQRWQLQHWRTLESVYRRTPYFEHYAPTLRPLFETTFGRLADFNKATIAWVKQQLGLPFTSIEATAYLKDYPADVMDLRRKWSLPAGMSLPVYFQVFGDRAGFIPDLSILDLLFAEGPLTINRIKNR